MKNDQAVTDSQLRKLVEASPERGPLVSLILPMERGGPEVRKNATMLRNAVRQARTLLAEAGHDESEADRILGPVEAMADDSQLWQHQEEALAVYAGDGGVSHFVLSHPFKEYISVGERYYLTPLLHAVANRSPAYVLLLSQKQVALFALKNGHLSEVEVEDLPGNMNEALLFDNEQEVRRHPVTSRAEHGPVLGAHGHGVGKDTRVGHLMDFFHRVEAAVSRYMEKRGAPLYLATVEENEAHYRKTNKYNKLAERALHGNFDRHSERELLTSLASQLEEDIGQTVEQRCREIGDAVAEGNGTADLDRAVEMAWDGRVHACCVALNAPHQTGTWNPDTRSVRHDSQPNPRHVDLVDLVATLAWDKGGEIRFVESTDQMPESAPVAVSLRY